MRLPANSTVSETIHRLSCSSSRQHGCLWNRHESNLITYRESSTTPPSSCHSLVPPIIDDHLSSIVNFSPTTTSSLSSKHSPSESSSSTSTEFLLNSGKVITVLREDLPAFFDHDFNYSIYTPDMLFCDTHQRLCVQGSDHYAHLIRLTRTLLRWYFVEPQLKLLSIHTPPPSSIPRSTSSPSPSSSSSLPPSSSSLAASSSEIHVRWMFRGIPRWYTVWHGRHIDRQTSFRCYEGLSIYRLHPVSGWVREHILEKIVPPPRIFMPLRTYMRWHYFWWTPSIGIDTK
jgi:hypothetical protein